MTSTLLILAMGFLAGLTIPAGIAARGRAGRRKRQRIVEGPNSAYTSKLVRDRDTQHRWEQIPLERLHEINREEARRLLERVAAEGVDVLKPRERTFLETLAANLPPDPDARLRPGPSLTQRERSAHQRPRQELHPPF